MVRHGRLWRAGDEDRGILGYHGKGFEREALGVGS